MAPPSHPVDLAAARLAPSLVIDEQRDVVSWCLPDGTRREAGLHDYAALYAVQGLYEAVYAVRLRATAPQLLVAALSDVVPEPARAALSVLDVGAGTGGVGAALWAAGFRRIAGTDIEPASAAALRRDRSEVYSDVRIMDLSALADSDAAWLTTLAPDVVSVAGAVGYGHLPVEALDTVVRTLRPGGLLALTTSADFEVAPELRDFAALLTGPLLRERTWRVGPHRRTAGGGTAQVAALVLERTTGAQPAAGSRVRLTELMQ